MVFAAETGGIARAETFVVPPDEIMTSESSSPTAALFAEASVATGTSRTKLTPLPATGSVTRDDASTAPLFETACIVASSVESIASCL